MSVSLLLYLAIEFTDFIFLSIFANINLLAMIFSISISVYLLPFSAFWSLDQLFLFCVSLFLGNRSLQLVRASKCEKNVPRAFVIIFFQNRKTFERQKSTFCPYEHRYDSPFPTLIEMFEIPKMGVFHLLLVSRQSRWTFGFTSVRPSVHSYVHTCRFSRKSAH